MSRKTLYLLLIILTIIVTCYLQWLFCCSLCKEDNNSVIEKPDNITNTVNTNLSNNEATKYPFIVKDSKQNELFKFNDNFNFKKSDSEFLKPLSQQITKGVDSLKSYISKNKNQYLLITGYYTEDEKNTSNFSNLGFARANAIKNYLVEKGFPAENIKTQGLLNNDMIPDSNNIFYGPASFNFKQNEAEDPSKLLAEINKNPIIFNFNSGASETPLTTSQQQNLERLSRYLKKAPKGEATIVGHTDNRGNINYNHNLGLQRANFIKKQLIKMGVSNKKIKIISKGESQPISDNNTEQGRAKNRRAKFIIK